MKNFIVLLIFSLFSCPLFSQDSKITLPRGAVSGSYETSSGVSSFDSAGKPVYAILATSYGKSAAQNYPWNYIEINTGFGYFSTAKTIRISFLFYTLVNIADMRYRIMDSYSNIITDWNIPEGKVTKDALSSNISKDNILMPVTEYEIQQVECENKVINVQLYDIKKPENILTLIISTIPIERPILFGSIATESTRLIPVANNSYYQIPDKIGISNIEGNHTFGQDEIFPESADIYLNTKNSPLVYNIYLVREMNKIKDSVLLPEAWDKVNNSEIHIDSALKKISNLQNNIFTWHTYVPVQFIKNTGKYEILAVPKFWEDYNFYKKNLVKINFTVNRSENHEWPVIAKILFIITLVLITKFLFDKAKQKRMIRKKEMQIREAKLKLQSIRSQLNPHFIFNALSGIQNLMHKNETEKANDYLNTFSRLTRSVLDDSNKENITLDNEIKMLDDYLKMEQMRFGFQYHIHADETLDRHNIEIPSMLLQPFAENAVKHGISSLKEKGRIVIDFKKSGNNIVMSIADNGSGFDASKEYSGMGIQLSKSRVSLLNEVYKNTPLNLEINPTGSGTVVVITLQNWLL